MTKPGRPHTLHSRTAVFSRASFLAVAALLSAGSLAIAQVNLHHTQAESCGGDNGGITLSPGFCATIFADNLGHARQMAFGPNGVLYVNTWSGRYYHDAPPPPGGFLIALKDTKGDGHANQIERFGPGVAQGSAGGTGIRVYKNGLYAEQNDKIIRYPLPADGGALKGGLAPKEEAQGIVSGM